MRGVGIKHTRLPLEIADRFSQPGWRYAWSALLVAAATGLMLIVRSELGTLNVAMIFLLVTFALALLAGSGPAVGAALLSFLAFDFFFILPYHTFAVERDHHILALFSYLGIAIVTGQLVARVRARTEAAERERLRTGLLYELNAALIGDVTLDSILSTIVERVVAVYGAARSRILLPESDDTLTVRSRYPLSADATIDRQDLAVARWVIEHRSPAGRGTSGRHLHRPRGTAGRAAMPPGRGNDLLFLPIATTHHVVGVLEVAGRPGGGRFGNEDEQILTNFANHAALALERTRLAGEVARAAAVTESDALKSALLAAVSHDLRTPLAAIKASVTSMLDTSVTWDAPARSEFLQAIDEETDRLTLVVGNLLDLSRIEGGALRPAKEWYDVAELVADVATRLTSLATRHCLTTEVERDLPLVCFDYVEIAQVLMNLGENAIKYTPPGTGIALAARARPGAVELAVRDRGPGIPAALLPRIFDTFYRVDRSSRVRGTGIGLTISKGLVEAHGGEIWAESLEGEGTVIRFTLPLETEHEEGR